MNEPGATTNQKRIWFGRILVISAAVLFSTPVWVFIVWRNSASYQMPAPMTLVGGAFILAGLCMRYVSLRKCDLADEAPEEKTEHQ